MGVNSAAIYGSKPVAPYQSGNVVFTTVGKAVYVIYLAAENEKTMPALIKISNWTPPQGSKAIMLGSNKTLSWKSNKGNTEISIPSALRNHPPSDYAWVLKFEL